MNNELGLFRSCLGQLVWIFPFHPRPLSIGARFVAHSGREGGKAPSYTLGQTSQRPWPDVGSGVSFTRRVMRNDRSLSGLPRDEMRVARGCRGRGSFDRDLSFLGTDLVSRLFQELAPDPDQTSALQLASSQLLDWSQDCPLLGNNRQLE